MGARSIGIGHPQSGDRCTAPIPFPLDPDRASPGREPPSRRPQGVEAYWVWLIHRSSALRASTDAYRAGILADAGVLCEPTSLGRASDSSDVSDPSDSSDVRAAPRQGCVVHSPGVGGAQPRRPRVSVTLCPHDPDRASLVMASTRRDRHPGGVVYIGNVARSAILYHRELSLNSTLSPQSLTGDPLPSHTVRLCAKDQSGLVRRADSIHKKDSLHAS